MSRAESFQQRECLSLQGRRPSGRALRAAYGGFRSPFGSSPSVTIPDAKIKQRRTFRRSLALSEFRRWPVLVDNAATSIRQIDSHPPLWRLADAARGIVGGHGHDRCNTENYCYRIAADAISGRLRLPNAPRTGLNGSICRTPETLEKPPAANSYHW